MEQSSIDDRVNIDATIATERRYLEFTSWLCTLDHHFTELLELLVVDLLVELDAVSSVRSSETTTRD